MGLWISNAGDRREQLVPGLQPVHGGMSRTRAPLWIDQDGRRLRVERRLERWVGYDVLGHQSVSASGFECLMSDGSTWLLVHDLMNGSWLGAPMDGGQA